MVRRYTPRNGTVAEKPSEFMVRIEKITHVSLGTPKYSEELVVNPESMKRKSLYSNLSLVQNKTASSCPNYVPQKKKRKAPVLYEEK